MEVSRSTVRGTAPAPRRRVVLLATCAAGLFLAAWAPDALAQTTSKTKTVNKDFTTTVQSPCPTQSQGEAVDINGTDSVQTQQIQQSGNITKFSFAEHKSGQGVGQVSANQYRFEDMSQNATSVSSTTCQFYIRITTTTHLIRQGSKPPVPDDFFARSRLLIVMTKDCQTTLTLESFDAAECK